MINFETSTKIMLKKGYLNRLNAYNNFVKMLRLDALTDEVKTALRCIAKEISGKLNMICRNPHHEAWAFNPQTYLIKFIDCSLNDNSEWLVVWGDE